MGIKGLTSIISDVCPNAIAHADMKSLFGRKVAIDASMSVYQFLIAVRQQDGQQLMNDAGETTSHLMGFFYRTIRMIDHGLKPAYVFDGKPPDLKSGVLKRRFTRREDAEADNEEAKETGTAEDMDRFTRRTVKVTQEHNEECRRLLGLMGIPYIVAPSEAEAQCAELARGGLVYGAGSEDMDTLTFNSPLILKHLTFSEARKMPIDIIKLEDVLKGLEMDYDQFIDYCILCGCDYLEPLKGIGAKTALKHLRDYKNVEGVLEHLKTTKNPPPEDWPFQEARELFRNPDVINSSDVNLHWKEPDVDGLVQFLVTEKGFNEERVRKGAEKLKAALGTKQQGRLDNFFSKMPSKPSDKTDPKRKASAGDKKNSKKAKTGTKGTTKK